MDGAEEELSSVWWGSEAMEERGFWEGWGRREKKYKWDSKPLWVFVLKTISSRLIVSMDLYFHFFEPSFETKFTFASCEHEFCPVKRRM